MRRPSEALAALAADPDAVDSLSEGELADVLAVIERLRVRILVQANRPREENGTDSDEVQQDQLLDVEGVAEILEVSEKYVYEHADQWPFTRKISPRKLRFSERGLYRWLETLP